MVSDTALDLTPAGEVLGDVDDWSKLRKNAEFAGNL